MVDSGKGDKEKGDEERKLGTDLNPSPVWSLVCVPGTALKAQAAPATVYL